MSAARKFLLVFGLLGLFLPQTLQGQTPEPVVHAVLFYSPTCPHCHQVINEQLIPLQNRYGNRLVILGMDTSQEWANALYWDAIRHFQIPEADWVVPILIVGEEVLIGGFRIAGRFPTLIEEGLAAEGIDLPNHPALVDFLREQNALDPRYPDRLIARQGPPPQGDEPPAGADSSAAGAEPSPQDSVAAQDSAAVVDSVVTQDSAAVVDSAAVPAQRSETDSVSGRGAGGAVDSAEAVAAEAGIDPDPDPVRKEEPPPVSDTMEPAPMEEAREGGEPRPDPETAPETGTDAAGDPRAEEEVGRLDSVPGDLGTLGIQQAARELDAMTMWDRFQIDPGGNTLSVLVLLGMVLSLALRGYPPRIKGGRWPGWVVPALVLVGVGVAAYLSFIEITQTEAVCGPVGDCNTVNQSKYAVLFGFLPVGVFGLMGYGIILICWALARGSSEERARIATLGLWAAALFGTLFSVYLTFLEPFVIGATCAWCLTSAVVVTLILWAVSPLAAEVWSGRKPLHPSN
jgi:uncharacterized membrane protein/thiol-disulfide isomerase/thioredoxin